MNTQKLNTLTSRLLFVYRKCFKTIILMNVSLSVLLVLSLQKELSINLFSVVSLLLFSKLFVYFLSIVIEKLFYEDSRKAFLYNLGLSYTRIFAFIFLFDSLFFILMIALCRIVLNW